MEADGAEKEPPGETYSDIESSDLDELLAGESLDGILAAELHALLVSVGGDTDMGGASDASLPPETEPKEGSNSSKTPAMRKRMRAVDMFADSESEGDS